MNIHRNTEAISSDLCDEIKSALRRQLVVSQDEEGALHNLFIIASTVTYMVGFAKSILPDVAFSHLLLEINRLSHDQERPH